MLLLQHSQMLRPVVTALLVFNVEVGSENDQLATDNEDYYNI